MYELTRPQILSRYKANIVVDILISEKPCVVMLVNYEHL